MVKIYPLQMLENLEVFKKRKKRVLFCLCIVMSCLFSESVNITRFTNILEILLALDFKEKN